MALIGDLVPVGTTVVPPGPDPSPLHFGKVKRGRDHQLTGVSLRSIAGRL